MDIGQIIMSDQIVLETLSYSSRRHPVYIDTAPSYVRQGSGYPPKYNAQMRVR